MKLTAFCLVLAIASTQAGLFSSKAEPSQTTPIQEATIKEPTSQVMTWCSNMMNSLKVADYASFFLLFNEESVMNINNPLFGVLHSRVQGLDHIKNVVRQFALSTEFDEIDFQILAVDEAKAICISQWNSSGHFVETGSQFEKATSTMITKFSATGLIMRQTTLSTDPQLFLGFSTQAEKNMGKVWWTWFSDPAAVRLTLDSPVFSLVSPTCTVTIQTMPPFILSKTVFTGHQGLLDARQELFSKLVNPRDLAQLKFAKFVILASDEMEVYMSLPLESEEDEIVERFFHIKFDERGLLSEVDIMLAHVIRPWDLATQPGAVSPPGARVTEMVKQDL